MPGILITGYGLTYNPRMQKGTVGIVLQNGQKMTFKAENGAEFAALAVILNESPIYMLPDFSISTELEPPGGD